MEWFLIVGGLTIALMYWDGLRVWWSTRSKLTALLSSLVARQRFGCFTSFAWVFDSVCCWVLVFVLSLFVLRTVCFGDGALVGLGSFLLVEHLFSRSTSKIRIRLALSVMFKPSSRIFILAVPGRCFFCNPFWCLYLMSVMLSCLFLAALWSSACND